MKEETYDLVINFKCREQEKRKKRKNEKIDKKET